MLYSLRLIVIVALVESLGQLQRTDRPPTCIYVRRDNVSRITGTPQAVAMYRQCYISLFVFRYSFRPGVALFLSLIFLIHPLDSQVVYEIAALQDALFFFFGILGLYLLFRLRSVRSLVLVAICFFLSLLAKETGMLFVAMALLYLIWYNRKRLYWFVGIMIMPIVIYMSLRAQAIGWSPNPNNAPIDRLSLTGRLLTDPSIILLFISKFVFPYKLAAWYYWVYPNFSIRHFLFPLAVDLGVVSFIIYLAIMIRRNASKAKYVTFLYFAIWSAIGLLLVLQFTPLDMTASETWFYFPMVGVLGMIGIIITTFGSCIHIDRRIIFILTVVIILLLGLRSAIRGKDWSGDYKLAVDNIAASSEDFQSENEVAIYYFDHANYYEARIYAQQSVSAFPYATNYNVLGATLTQLGDYNAAHEALENGLKYGELCTIYDNLSILTAYYGSPDANQRILISAVRHCSQDSIPWLFLAIYFYNDHNIASAQQAVTKSYQYYNSSVPLPVPAIYDRMMSNQPLNLTT